MNESFMKEKPVLPLLASMAISHGAVHAGKFFI